MLLVMRRARVDSRPWLELWQLGNEHVAFAITLLVVAALDVATLILLTGLAALQGSESSWVPSMLGATFDVLVVGLGILVAAYSLTVVAIQLYWRVRILRVELEREFRSEGHAPDRSKLNDITEDVGSLVESNISPVLREPPSDLDLSTVSDHGQLEEVRGEPNA